MAGRLKDTGSERGHAGPSATTAEISSKQFCTKIIVSNIHPAVKREELVSFLQSSNVSCAVDDFQELPSRNGAAVLTLAAPVDVVNLREICKSTPLQGQVLQIEAAEGLEDAESSGARATSGAQSVPVTTRATSSHVCLEALVSGIPPTVTDDYLTNLLECATDDCDVKNVRRGTKEGVAVVVFEKHVDTDEIQSFCDENAEDGNVLRVEPVANTGAVLIRNPPPEITTGSFKFYLSNTKRSGGSKGVTIDRDAHNLYLVAKFDSRDVAERVAKRQHILEGHELQLKLFDFDLDDPPNVDDGQCDVTSTSHSVPQSSASSLGAASADVAPHHQEKTSDCDGGREHETRNITTYFENMRLQEKKQKKEKKPMEIKKTFEGLHDVYVYILDAFSELIAEEFHITITTVETLVMIEGEERDVEKVEQLLSVLFERQRSSQYIREVADRFTGWEDMFTDIEKRIANGGYYYLVPRECLVAGSAAEELCIGLLSPEDNSGPMTFDEFLRMHVCVYKSKVAVKSEAARDLLSTTTVFNEFVVTKFEEKYGPKVQMFLEESHEQIILLGPPELLEDAADDVERFLEEKSDQQTIDLNSKQRYFLNFFCSTELESLQRGTGLKYAHIQIKGNVCEIQGCRAGVTNAAKSLKDTIKKICCRRAIFTHPNLASMLQSRKEMWDPMVGRVSQENCCIITELPDPRFQDADNDSDEWGQWNATVINSFPLPGGQVVLYVTDGNAEDLKVDAAVLCYKRRVQSSTIRQKRQSTQASVQNTGARPKSHGNSSNRDEHQPSDQPRGINVTQSGALPCKAVIHVDISHYFAEGSSAAFEVALQVLMTDIFQECDRHHFSSLALPVFGVDMHAGDVPQPIDVATTGIAMCCCNALAFDGQLSQNSSVGDVFLCSRRAACLHGLTFALEDQDGPSLPKLSPFPETFQRLSCQQRGNRQTALNMNAISVSLGDISSVDADVLIVPLDIDIGLDLDESKVTRSLMMNGGKSVQFSIQHRTGSYWTTVKCIDDNNEELADQHLLVGSPGHLNAKHIFYVYIPPWGPGVIKMLRERVQKCLRKAVEKGCQTVAMTALGVGKLGYPVEFAARTSIAAVADFMDQGKTSLENINFVMLPSDPVRTIQAFRAEQSKWQLQRVCAKGGQMQPQNATQPTVNRHSYYSEPSAFGRRRGRENNLSPRTPAWETVWQRGYRPGPTRQDAVSLFIFSDSEERRQAAVEEIATGIVSILGPVETEEPWKISCWGRKETR